jgi:N-6 DNA Methylase
MAALDPRPDLGAFLAHRLRLPRLGDARPPWRYRGWLLAYVIVLHERVPAVGDRWGYYLRTREAGRLLDEPVPPVAFGPPDERVFRLLHDWSRLVGRDGGGWGDFRTLLDWLCWGLALSRDEPRLADAANEQLYRRVDLGPLLERPHDYLGEYAARGKAKGWNPTGFYATPHPVVECMARRALHDAGADGRDPRTLRVCDPAVGSGRMLLHAANVSLCLYGQDLDPLAVAMCQVNGALYAPWLAFPLPASILGTRIEPPPAPLPVPQPLAVPAVRVDDDGQGLLFAL